MLRFDSKDIAEVVDLPFDFTTLIASGDSISGVTVDVAVWDTTGGAGDANPTAIRSGAASTSGTTVTQRITGGVAGVVYLLTCTATTADGIVRVVRGTLSVTGLIVPSVVPASSSVARINGLNLGGTLITASATEINHLSGVTSGIQAQINLKAPITSPTFGGTPTAPTAAVHTNTTQIATTAFVRAQIAAQPPGPAVVLSVAGRTGDVVVTKSDVGLGNVDNTPDSAKPISVATQAALDLKAPLNNPVFSGVIGLATAGSASPALSDTINITGPGAGKLWWLLRGTTTAEAGLGPYGISLDTTHYFSPAIKYDPILRYGYNLGWGNQSINGTSSGMGIVLESNYVLDSLQPTLELYSAIHNPVTAFACRPQMITYDTVTDATTMQYASDLYTWDNGARTNNWMSWTPGIIALKGSTYIVGGANNVGFLYGPNVAGNVNLEIARIDDSNRVRLAANGTGVGLGADMVTYGRAISWTDNAGTGVKSVIDANGKFGGNVPSPSSFVEVQTDASANPAIRAYAADGVVDKTLLQLDTYAASTGRNYALLRHARGTKASPAAIATNDYIGLLGWMGYDGAAWRHAARIDTIVDGTVASGYVPGALVLSSANAAGTMTERLRLPSAGGLKLPDHGATTKPAAGSAARFVIWTVAGGAGVADTVEICVKGADDIYTWRSLI